ncbi:MAG TPA: hypothetical protein VMB25_05690 [Bryobacteraceae bacterium]|nr:hypothetical protein [Bryobacteraceae bacterium]
MTLVWMVLLAAGFFAAAFAGIFWALAFRRSSPTPGAEWLEEFSLDSYAPMERLLDPGDVAFLAAQPGYRPEIGKRLMRERRKIFKDYLKHLSQDFHQLIALGKVMLVYSSEDRPELARNLLRQQVRFQGTLCAVRLQLALHPLGWSLVDVRALVESVDAMRYQVQELALRRAALTHLG